MSKFKVGDRVRVVRNGNASDGVRAGETGTVMEESNCPWLRMDAPTAYGAGVSHLGIPAGYANCVGESYLELIREEAAPRTHRNVLPTDAAARNAIPMADGLLFYFPNALAAVAALSKVANEQHNPGEPMHWARNKSTDHANKIIKHLVDAGGFDTDGQRHSAKVAWRALALLEDELIAEGAVPGRNTRGEPGRAASAALTESHHNCIEDEL